MRTPTILLISLLFQISNSQKARAVGETSPKIFATHLINNDSNIKDYEYGFIWPFNIRWDNSNSNKAVISSVYGSAPISNWYIGNHCNLLPSFFKNIPITYSITPASGGVITVTTGNVDVNPYLHSATVQDLFHTGARSNFAPRDVVAQPFLSMMDSLGWNDLHYPGGAQVDNYHVIIGETRVYGGKGSGYNGHCSDFEHNPYHKCEDVNDGALLFPFPNDFFNAYKQFADTLGAACSVDGNVAFGSLEEQLWMIKHTNAWLWVAGVEDNVARNDYIWPHGGTYRRKVQAWIDVIKKQYPNVKTAIDVAPVWRKDQRSRRWNDSLRTMKSDYVRAYDQIGDLLDDWTDHPKENLDSIVRALEVINPARFKASFQKYNRPAAIIQWYAPFEGNFPPNYRFTNFSCLYMGLEYEFFYKDQVGDRNIAYAAQWNLRQLIDKKNNPKPEYWAQKNYNKMFGKGRKWLKVSGADSKLHVYGSVNPLTGDYQVAIVNPTSSTFPLPSISFDGQTSNRYSAFSIHSNDLLSTRPEIGTPKQIDSYSTMIVRFKRSQ